MVTGFCYAVAIGRKPGIYNKWSDCQSQVLNFKGAKFRKFLRLADAKVWMNQNVTGPYLVQTPKRATTSHEMVASTLEYSSTLKPEESTAFQGLELDQLDGVYSKLSVTSVIEQHSTTETMIVYTDGSCKGNGKGDAIAGVGVWWGIDDPRNICERCPGVQTNNRAELIAIVRVLENTPTDRPLLIKSDSIYSIHCMTRWLWGWKAKGWKKRDGKPVMNVPLVKYLDVLLDERRTLYKQDVQFEWIKGHIGHSGNEYADALACAGTKLPPVPDRDWDALIRAAQARIMAASSSSSTEMAENALQGEDYPPKAIPRDGVPQPVLSHTTRQPMRMAPRMCGSASQSTSPRVPPSRHSTPSPPASESGVTLGANISDRKSRIPLSWNEGDVHGSANIKISQKELEAYAACLLSEDELLEEARAMGVC